MKERGQARADLVLVFQRNAETIEDRIVDGRHRDVLPLVERLRPVDPKGLGFEVEGLAHDRIELRVLLTVRSGDVAEAPIVVAIAEIAFAHDETAQAELDELLREPSLYDEFLAYLSRQGYDIPARLLDRDWSLPRATDDDLVEVFAGVYAAPAEHWGVYETCEELVDIEDAFQQWRFRHLQVVQRTIGHKTGTGGSSGVDFLRRALNLTFFPELYEVRTRIGE